MQLKRAAIWGTVTLLQPRRSHLNPYVLIITAAVALPALAGDRLSLRAGLWELTLTSALTTEQVRLLSTDVPQELLAQLPPPQRAEFKRLFESGALLRNALNTIDTLCLTEEDLETGIRPGTDLDESCKVHATLTGKASQQVKLACDGPRQQDKGSGLIELAVSNPTTFTGTMTRSLKINGKALEVKVDLAGKWLDSQCGAEAEEEPEEPR